MKSPISSYSNLRFIIIINLLLVGNVSYSQVTFDSTYDAGGAEGCFNIMTNNNGFAMVMNSYQNPNAYQICSLDTVGQIINSKLYYTPGVNLILWSAFETFDHNFVTGCFYQDLSTNIRSLYFVKFDLQGDTLWSRLYSAPSGFQYYGRYFIQTSDSGLLFSGAYVDTALTNAEFCLLKTDSLGNLQWINTFGGNSTDDAFSSVETPDKGFLTLGYTRSFGFGNSSNRDDMLVKWDSLGNYQWHKTFGTINEDIGIGITKCMDGNYLLGSGKYMNSSNSQSKIIKIDVDGNIIWQKTFGIQSDSFWWVREKLNNDIIAVGSEGNSNNFQDGFILCTDSAGNEKWRRQYRTGLYNCYFRDVKETSDGGIICCGFGQGASGNQDGWLVKLDSTGCLSGTNCGEPTGLIDASSSTAYQISVAPNPITTLGLIKVEGLPARLMSESYRLRVYDLTGRLVQSPETGFLVSDNWIECIFKPAGLKTGVYLLQISTYAGERLGIARVVVAE